MPKKKIGKLFLALGLGLCLTFGAWQGSKASPKIVEQLKGGVGEIFTLFAPESMGGELLKKNTTHNISFLREMMIAANNSTNVKAIDKKIFDSILTRTNTIMTVSPQMNRFVSWQKQTFDRNILMNLLKDMDNFMGSPKVEMTVRQPPKPFELDPELMKLYYRELLEYLGIDPDKVRQSDLQMVDLGIDLNWRPEKRPLGNYGKGYNPSSLALDDKNRKKYRPDLIVNGYTDQDYYVDNNNMSRFGIKFPNPFWDDKDSDGVFHFGEKMFDISDMLPDTDGDGFKDLTEIILGTDPNNKNSYPRSTDDLAIKTKELLTRDTDHDGYDDLWELIHGTDPTNRLSPGPIIPRQIAIPGDRYNMIQRILSMVSMEQKIEAFNVEEIVITDVIEDDEIAKQGTGRYVWEIFKDGKQLKTQTSDNPKYQVKFHQTGVHEIKCYEIYNVQYGSTFVMRQNDYWVMAPTGQLLWSKTQKKEKSFIEEEREEQREHVGSYTIDVTESMLEGSDWLVGPSEVEEISPSERIK